MKFSTRGRYGLRALLDLAVHGGDKMTPLKDIARREEISLHYLERLMAPLISAGLVTSVRGVGGGVALSRAPAEIRVSEVIEALEGPIAPTECAVDPSCCGRSGLCVSREVWSEMGRAIAGVLESTTLQDLADRQMEKGQTQKRKKATDMYYI
ncbi:MAG: Rrf2 family transcriptional regulator [Dehalococcoidia bacterium]